MINKYSGEGFESSSVCARVARRISSREEGSVKFPKPVLVNYQTFFIGEHDGFRLYSHF